MRAVIGGLRGAEDLLLRRLGLLHQLDLLVFDLEDVRLARLDFVGQRAVFLVLPGLELLVGIADDQLLLGFDLQFQVFAVGLDLLDAQLGMLQRRLGGGGLGLERLPLRFDVGQFALSRGGFSGPGPAGSAVFQWSQTSFAISKAMAGYLQGRRKSTLRYSRG